VKDLDLISTANDFGKHARNVYLMFLVFLSYIIVTIWSTTDIQLLLETPLKLPIINAEIPLKGFYSIISWFVILMHFNILLLLFLYSRNLLSLNNRMDDIADEKRAIVLKSQLFPFHFSHMIAGNKNNKIITQLTIFYSWATLILFPLLTLLSIQVRFLPYHDLFITWGHRLAIFFDIILLMILWPPTISFKRWSWFSKGIFSKLKKTGYSLIYFLRKSNQKNIKEKYVSLGCPVKLAPRSNGLIFLFLTALIVPIFSIFVATIPGEWSETWVLKVAPDSWLTDTTKKRFRIKQIAFGERKRKIIDSDKLLTLTYMTFHDGPFHRNLILNNQLLVKGQPSSELIASINGESKRYQKNNLKKIRGIDLEQRDLRYSDFSSAILFNAKLEMANLEGADLSYAHLQGSNLAYADLSNSQMTNVNLSGAELYKTNLENADLKWSHFENANLSADFTNAEMGYANFKNAVFSNSQLHSADLSFAKLHGAQFSVTAIGADFSNAEFQGANLQGSYLVGSIFSTTQFQSANLRNVNLEGTYMQKSNFQGSDLSGAKLTGADLRGAKFGGAVLKNTTFRLADLRGIELSNMKENEYLDLQTTLNHSLEDEATKSDILESLKLSKDRNTTLEYDLIIQDTLCDSALISANCLSSNSLDIYDQKLASYLLSMPEIIEDNLSCDSELIANALARRMWKYSSGRSLTRTIVKELLDEGCKSKQSLSTTNRANLEDQLNDYMNYCYIEGKIQFLSGKGKHEFMPKISPLCTYYTGVEYYRNKRYKEAMEKWEELFVTKNYPQEYSSLLVSASNSLGYIHFYGLLGYHNVEKALEYWEMASSQGERESTYHLCVSYANPNSPVYSKNKSASYCKSAKNAYNDIVDKTDSDRSAIKAMEKFL
jgi:uncharacterized protein YjbI with pentapeptide repeats